ncbi:MULTISPECIES: YrrS family protein [unclassified Bacillus (in: firmicutes)]|uniref:YrrS family protein n=1 Tax=unclassified Bacillus (in: firmicutes) TaxID=185979 RepID=UPI0008F1AD74|nr:MULTISPECIES: YrrS family protein [unclassified Bacillus (in: firmicutes)]SFA95055.1 Protein of unknown function [Bacillus sp. UNCCL13]SFQ78856.1 Protein of unknown function [Bacillus sp. cl95]
MNHENSRTGFRSKRKKTNLILNSLIGLVILLIIIVSAVIFMGDDENANQEKAKTNNVASEKAAKNKKDENESAVVTDEEDSEVVNEESEGAEESEDSETALEPETDNVVTSGGSDSNVEETIENPGWKSVGTTQSGDHATVYDESSADWQEMLAAMSYATGIDQSNMTVWYLGNNNGNPNSSIGTVSTKDKQQTYRVYLDWVDGQGWKPAKVEKLVENDKD